MTNPTRPATPSASPASSQPFPDPIPGRIAFGTVTLLNGEARIGKSPLVLEFCVRMRDRRTIFGRPTNPPTAFYYLATDRGWADSYQHWCNIVGFPDIPHYAIADDMALDLTMFANERNAFHTLTVCLDKLNPIPGSHVIVDTVSPIFVAGDPNRSRPVWLAVQRWRRECKKRLINFTATIHQPKQLNDGTKQYKRLIDRSAGSGQFAGQTDNQFSLVGPTDDEPAYIFEWNPPHAPAEQIKLERLPNGLFAPFTGFTEQDTVIVEAKPQALPVLELIPAEGVIAYGELVQRVQESLLISEATIKRLLENLQAAGLIERPHGYVKRRKVN
jgi:hypothetical protein